MVNTYTSTCDFCGKQFDISLKHSVAYRAKRRFCSNKCRIASAKASRVHLVRVCSSCGIEHTRRTKLCFKCYENRPREYRRYDGEVDTRYSKTCPVCQATFYKPITISLAAWNNARKYCSRQCHGISLEKPPVTCKRCGMEFIPKNTAREKAVYCSTDCRNEDNKKPLPLCEVCGETCRKRGRRFCSPECKGAWYRGENVYNYAGEATLNLYTSAFWDQQAQLVRDRDKVCQHCGALPQKGKVLNVHHIVPYHVSHDSSLDNLIALCNRCHTLADTEWRKSVIAKNQIVKVPDNN